MTDGILLTSITFLPLIGALVVLGLHRKPELAKPATLLFMLLGFGASLLLWFKFPGHQSFNSLAEAMVFKTEVSWMPTFGIKFALGVDGISLLLILMTTLLGPLLILAAWHEIQERVIGFCFCLLLMQTGMLGAFMALDLFLFYVFGELLLVPLFFLVGVWGGKRRIYSAVKFLLYTMFGSALMLIAITYIGTQFKTFDLLQLYKAGIPAPAQHWLFVCFALAFLIKVPVFPFHTWLPDASVESSTPGSVVLAGVFLKLGTYGFLRFAMPLFPQALATYAQPLMILAVIGIIYGGLVAVVQTDIKKLIAYASVSQLGLIMLGLLAMNIQGVQGSIIQMVNHGLSVGALFLLVGMVYTRRQTRSIADFGGLAKSMPLFAFFFVLFAMSFIGLPGLNGFVGEFLILMGAFAANKLYAFVAGLGIVLGALYMLWLLRRFLFGPLLRIENRNIADLDRREIGMMVVLSIFVVWIGISPGTFVKKTTPSVKVFLKHVRQQQRTPRRATVKSKARKRPAARR